MSAEGFEDSLVFVLRWEGGFVDNRNDRGGRTNKGVTQKVYDAARTGQNLDKRDVKLIEAAEMQAIYRKGYWLPSRSDKLASKLDLVQFDTAVNMGPGRAIRFLQAAVGCEVDGLYGQGTQKAVDACNRGTAISKYCDVREQFYRDLAATDSTQAGFLKGWLNRLNALRKAATSDGLESLSPEAAPDLGDTGYIGKLDDGSMTVEELRIHANGVLKQLKDPQPEAAHMDVIVLLEQLRNVREYELLSRIAEYVSRSEPENYKCRRLYVQALIETGKVTVAINVLEALLQNVPKTHPEWSEAIGLSGRAHKQIFVETHDKKSAMAQEALKQAVAAYRKGFQAAPAKNTWHGVNLLALLKRAGKEEIPVSGNPSALAKRLLKLLESVPAEERDDWYLATLAETYLGLENLEAVEKTLKAYVAGPGAKAFLVWSTLRQFTDVWSVQKDSDLGAALVDILRARLMQLPGGEMRLDPAYVREQSKTGNKPSDGQLEAVLGENGTQTFKWWQTGLSRARSVVSIRRRQGARVGTGFLVRAGNLGLSDLGVNDPEELLILTNYHVLNTHGFHSGLAMADAEIVFEALDPPQTYDVAAILWESPVALCDAAVLRPGKPITGVTPLPVATQLPDRQQRAQVYIIGHPLGNELAFSFQDNDLLDHEGLTGGSEQISGVCRVHYHAPTQPGNSGSPVFNRSWDAIALHHMGSASGLPRLNSVAGTYPANEGISLASITGMKKP